MHQRLPVASLTGELWREWRHLAVPPFSPRHNLQGPGSRYLDTMALSKKQTDKYWLPVWAQTLVTNTSL